MKQRIIVALVVASIVISGCKTGSASVSTPALSGPTTLAQAFDSAQAAGAVPKLDVSSDLAGPDLDRNGVRDDIDAYINQQPFTADQKASLRQLSKSVSASLLIDVTNHASLLAEATNTSVAVHCLYTRFPAQMAGQQHDIIHKYTLNTEARVRAYIKFSEALNGTAMEDPDTYICD